MWNIKNKEAVSPVIGVILMVAITVVLAAVLYVWVSGFMTSSSGGVYAVSTGTWTANSAGTAASTNVVSTQPASGIKGNTITWQLYNVTSSAVESATWSGTLTDGTAVGDWTSSTEYLKAGCTITVTPATAGTGDYKVRAIVGGSQVYESATFTF